MPLNVTEKIVFFKVVSVYSLLVVFVYAKKKDAINSYLYDFPVHVKKVFKNIMVAKHHVNNTIFCNLLFGIVSASVKVIELVFFERDFLDAHF